MASSEQLLEKWKKRLLDLGKRNRLINYRETKRSSLKIISPGLQDLYERLVLKEEQLEFPYFEEDFNRYEDQEEVDEEYPHDEGDIQTDGKLSELQKTLRNLRSKARTANEEQGVNILYLSFGFLRWNEIDTSDRKLTSPIILVPVTLTLESISSPFKIGLHEDEIIVNPTLFYKMENDFGLILPDFDNDEGDVKGYLRDIQSLVSRNGWEVLYETGLSLLSFLKINMYKDLENNRDRILSNPIVRAWSGDLSGIQSLSEEFNNYDHDKRIKPKESFQVLDADASQQDAILYTKKGMSYVLQGPPGTGKSQTITNIISEGLADGKKILFVSEKMAALEVVYKRISQSGLADFCLPLHSHRANKKEVLAELGKSLNLNKIKVQEDALYQLDRLKMERDLLNQYDNELHTPCGPLGKTAYEVNGLLARRHYAPDIIFSLDKVGETTPDQLNEYVYLLSEFSKTIGSMSGDYAENPWRDCKVPTLTHEFRHDIETKLRRLLIKLRKLGEDGIVAKRELGLELNLSLATISDLIKILKIASMSPKVPAAWFYEMNMEPLMVEARNYKELKTEYIKLFREISENFKSEYFLLPASKVEVNFFTSLEKVKKFINPSSFPTDELVSNAAHSILSNLTTSIEKLNAVEQISKSSVLLLGTREVENIKDLKDLTVLVEALIHNPKPNIEWFEPEKFSIVKRLVDEAKKTYEDINEQTGKVLKQFDREILKLDARGMLQRFQTKYSSILKIINPQYRQDRRTIKLLSLDPGKKLTDNVVIEALILLRSILDRKAWIDEQEELFVSLFGIHYQKEFTDWENFENSIKNFERIRDYFGNTGINQKTKSILLGGDPPTELDTLMRYLANVWETDFPSIVSQTINIPRTLELIELQELRDLVASMIPSVEGLATSYKAIKMFATQINQYDDLLLFLSKLKRWQGIVSLIEKQTESLKKSFLFLFDGIETNWDRIIYSLSWMDDFKRVNTTFGLSKEFVTKVCEDPKFSATVKKHRDLLASNLHEIKPEASWFFSLFDHPKDFINSDLEALTFRTEKCVNQISSLEEWIDFRRSRERCNEVGLSEYINQVQLLKISRYLIVPAFEKRFYRLWLDSVLPQLPAVYSFRSRVHEELIKEFSELDKQQLLIAQARVLERLIAGLPDQNQLTSSIDEVGILKRELNKQRRIKPLRKLFRQIPNLLLTLKPCLMMSPLSVSLFLETENYHFDIVIFDEASQVCTEDAIGAISRGTQVVIAGDSKQLPPTNFFTATISESDYDLEESEDDDVEDTDAYESVLEEAATVLPERTLRWHYRSRHEHLIAFSNKKIYRDSLITFPSPINNEQDVGVEYIRVPNGIYDRGGKRNNVEEAKKVAELVWDHAFKYPNRSLGIVTFSEAQQQAVEAAIRQRRFLDQRFEEFFREDKEDPFFIKNLENVQGDERDTIIISIGYARDHNGVMSLNFGPLNKDGGYRRLNVAITRAKYNVKLVGSIDPLDIAAENSNSEGIKLLRSYIDFAASGEAAFRKEITVPDVINVESPFEEAVYDFLVSKGFILATQVGCSGYRIDLAVEHPSLQGRYVLGIECDGASYHSARTARERDRLRQAVLEANGWRIYRVWSTDWIKDPITEGQKLCNAVEQAVLFYDENITASIQNVDRSNESFVSDTKLPIETLIELEPPTNFNAENPYDFDYYQEANISLVKRNPDNIKYVVQVIKYVIEEEFPIHYDLLSKRIAPLVGNQRTSSKLKQSISHIIARYLGKAVEARGKFYWPIGKSNVRVRVPNPDGTLRRVEHISTEELAEAMLVIARNSFGIPKKDLLVTTARVFGYNRNGVIIAQAMESACDYLLSTNRVKEVDEKIIPITNPN